MNLIKLANPAHVAQEAAGLAGTVAGAAGAVVGRTLIAGREVLNRVATAAAEEAAGVERAAPDHPQPAEPPLPGPDTVEFPPQPPAEPPVDVVGEALSGEEGPVTEGGAVVESPDLEPVPDVEPEGPLLDPGEAHAVAAEQEILRRAAD